ncbi:MAG: hypothetical protein KDA65_03375 [Planctomycetaceae bacterium]|nr:hypothetical protein [Planctomycetaceae bacterium]
MSRRRTTTEVEMGSDSFLDIIANIVGILIILIVIAAIRVSQAPVPTLNIEAAPEISSQQPKPEEELKTVSVPEVDPTPVHIELDEALIAQVEKLQTELTRLNEQTRDQSRQLNLLQADLEKASKENRSLNHQIEHLNQLRNRAELKRAELKEEQNKTQSRIDQLTRVLEEIEQQKSPTQELRHEVTPVSKQTSGKEIHFQIKNNQISVLPIEELIAEMKEEIPQNLNWLVKFNEYNGEVGPIRGFRMTYKVAREALSTLEQLQQGHGMMKVGVQRWELVQEELLLAETYETALEPNSSFQAALMQANSESTLTFWVYPDSFETFQKIKEVVHQNGFLVAARPIPFGAPIAGSPNGTHSASQ